MGQILVNCVGGFLDGEKMPINSSTLNYFNDNTQILSVRKGISKLQSHKAFNNKKCSILTTHHEAALFSKEEIDLYVLVNGDNSKPELAYYKYFGDYRDYLNSLNNEEK